MICLLLASSFLYLLVSVDGFSPPFSFPSLKTKTKSESRSLPDLEAVDEDGNPVRIPVKGIKRDWTWGDDYKAKGEFDVDLFVPEDGIVKGCAFFMHGFSQYPIAYRGTLKEAANKANVAIIAVETGITSKIVLEDTKNKPDGAGREWSQFALQRALSEDTKQCIRMVLEGDGVFEEYGVTSRAVKNKMAVMGHSMGGGLSYYVAAEFGKDIDYVFTMAPAASDVEEFNCINAVEKSIARNSMALAGGWDLVAPAGKVKEISVASNKQNACSSILVDVKQGLHTGFQDKVVLFNLPLSSGLGFAALLVNILGFADVIIFQIVRALLFILSLNKKRTGQLAGTRILMDYFLGSMAECKEVTLDGAERYLDDQLKDKFENNFVFSYPEEEI